MPVSEKPADVVEGTLPDSAKEQTKQEFEKLKEHNRRLSEKLSQYEQQQPEKTSVLDELRPQEQFANLTPAQVEQTMNSLVDTDGYVDVGQLNATLSKLNEETRRAQEEARIARERVERFEETEQVRAAHSQFPQLDPYNKEFDPRFYELVKNELIGQMMQGKQNLVEAAAKVKELYSAPKPQAVSTEVLAQQEQASATAGVSRQSSLPQDHASLDEGIYKGDSFAVGEALKAIGQ